MTEQEFIAEAKRRGKSREETLAKFNELKAAGAFSSSSDAEEPGFLERGIQRTSETAAELLAGAADSVLDTVDFAAGGGVAGYTPPLDPLAALRRQFGLSDDASVQDLLAEEMQPRNMQFLENPTTSKAVQMIGGLGGAGLASLPTAGAKAGGKAVGLAEEMLEGTFGLGVGLRAGADSVPVGVQQLRDMDDESFGVLMRDANDEAAGMRYKSEFGELDEIDAKAAKAGEKVDENVRVGRTTQAKAAKRKQRIEKGRQAEAEKVNQRVQEGFSNATDSAVIFGKESDESVAKHIARAMDITEGEALAVIKERGGIDEVFIPDSVQNIRSRLYARKNDDRFKEQNTGWFNGPKKPNGQPSTGRWIADTVSNIVQPRVAQLRQEVGKGFASDVSKGLQQATRQAAKINDYGTQNEEALKRVNEWMSQPEQQRIYQDLFINGVDGRAELLKRGREQLSAVDAKVLDEVFDMMYEHQKRMGDNVLTSRPGSKRDEVYAPGGTKAGMKEPEVFQGDDATMGQLAKRNRKSAKGLTTTELKELKSPIAHMFERMGQENDVIELMKAIGLPPSMASGSKMTDVQEAIYNHILSVTKDSEKARRGADIIAETLKANRQHANNFWQTMSNQAYAGTLAQFDSALLNFHDPFMTAVRAGVGPTVKAVMQGLTRSGMSAKELGVPASATAEYRDGIRTTVEQALDPKTTGEWIRDMSAKLTDFGFRKSLFQWADMSSKGITLRADFNNMQQLVAKGEDGMAALKDQYGHLLTPREWAEVTPLLKSGRELKDWPDRQLETMAAALRSSLGERQVLSMVNRPAAYQKHPNLRWMYNMTGFAIQLNDMIKVDVVDKVGAGEYKEAGKRAAQYIIATTMGYALSDTIRDIPAYAISSAAGNPNEKKAPTLENFGDRMVEGAYGPLTFNRYSGSDWDKMKFKQDPVNYLFDTLLLPSGLFGHAASGTTDLLSGDFNKAATHYLQAVPGVGRLAAEGVKATRSEGGGNKSGRRRKSRSKKRRRSSD